MLAMATAPAMIHDHPMMRTRTAARPKRQYGVPPPGAPIARLFPRRSSNASSTTTTTTTTASSKPRTAAPAVRLLDEPAAAKRFVSEGNVGVRIAATGRRPTENLIDLDVSSSSSNEQIVFDRRPDASAPRSAPLFATFRPPPQLVIPRPPPTPAPSAPHTQPSFPLSPLTPTPVSLPSPIESTISDCYFLPEDGCHTPSAACGAQTIHHHSDSELTPSSILPKTSETSLSPTPVPRPRPKRSHSNPLPSRPLPRPPVPHSQSQTRPLPRPPAPRPILAVRTSFLTSTNDPDSDPDTAVSETSAWERVSPIVHGTTLKLVQAAMDTRKRAYGEEAKIYVVFKGMEKAKRRRIRETWRKTEGEEGQGEQVNRLKEGIGGLERPRSQDGEDSWGWGE